MVITKKKLVCGVGVNDADYQVSNTALIEGKHKLIWLCPFYSKWVSMLHRCYSKKYQVKQPTYKGCTVISEWHLFSTFRTWMETQDWEGKEIDKDLLIPNNKEYSPQACIFVSSRVNSFCVGYKTSRNNLPMGVSFSKKLGKYISQGRYLNGDHAFLGSFEHPTEAHLAWLSFKLMQARILASEQSDSRVAQALIARYENYNIN